MSANPTVTLYAQPGRACSAGTSDTTTGVQSEGHAALVAGTPLTT